MIAALIFVAGILIALLGALMMISTAMPSFGGRRGNEGAVLVSGFIVFLFGAVLMFYAGTWA